MHCKKCGTFINSKTGICTICGGVGKSGKVLNSEDDSPEMINRAVSFREQQYNAFKESKKQAVYKENIKDSSIFKAILFILGILFFIIIIAIYQFISR